MLMRRRIKKAPIKLKPLLEIPNCEHLFKMTSLKKELLFYSTFLHTSVKV